MRTIATINFKGGVGKTTMSWLLAKYASEMKDKRILVVDTDAQMSLTLAVSLQEETGELEGRFEEWYEQHHKAERKTLLDALAQYDRNQGGYFDFSIDNAFIYRITDNLHFVPATLELYWLELETFDREKVKGFISALLGKLQYSALTYDYLIFDCPPNFTPLSYSVLSSINLILVPINPDVFAARGIYLIVEGLQHRIQPWPNPQMAVFMNKAKLLQGALTTESQRYWLNAVKVSDQLRDETNGRVNIKAWDTPIPERTDIKRAIPRGAFPNEFVTEFDKLWTNIEETLG